ncbi:hypothetical protein PsorP6_001435 [Peronosclerospora sorghi]|uniref:Uncharacterized protein n=1 Tax=Peronosclerospora sorghi TaxID=230839 RepID=A0ACC0WSV6_9STRA|nr:hypothetical protein PsorP6_001435 [Peronosclerospora sorghi]
MTISRNVYNQLFEQAADASEGTKEKVIRLRPTEAKAGAVVMSAKNKIQMWTKEEHERFLAALEKFPAGPWKKVADYIGTKTPRQTMTHAQKYRQKIHRRQRGLRNQKKSAPSDSNKVHSSSESPMPVNMQADRKVEPTSIVSPYGVADLQLKLGSEAAITAAADATNDQLLNILAHQATTINVKPESMQVDAACVDLAVVDHVALPDVAALATAEGNQSPNTNLPSLAEILHLGGAEGQAVEAEKIESATKVNHDAAADARKTATKVDMTETRPADCKCNSKCSLCCGKAALEKAAAQPEQL